MVRRVHDQGSAEFNKLNRRMHNKLFIADGKVAMLGGRNYQNRYFDWGGISISRIGMSLFAADRFSSSRLF